MPGQEPVEATAARRLVGARTAAKRLIDAWDRITPAGRDELRDILLPLLLPPELLGKVRDAYETR